jgi:hypothetical protein
LAQSLDQARTFVLGFGATLRVSVLEVADQKQALKELAKLVEKSTIDPLVRNAALAITSDCDARDDDCEIHAIYNAVKTGDARVKGLEKGLKYMSDPRWADFFSSPSRTLRQLSDGVNGEDCDGHSALVAAMLGSLGFIVGLRAWGKTKGEFTHVYSVVGYPKIDPTELVPLDTTVDEATPGWEPSGGHVLNAILTGE